MKWLKWTGIVLGGLLVLIILLINLAAFYFRMPDKRVEKHFEKANVEYKIHNDTYCNGPIRWIESGNLNSGTLIFFQHGAPGGFGDFSDYMIDPDFTQKTHMVTMDRLGYGFSNYGKGEPSIVEHVKAAQFVLDHYQPDTLILVGYSYGGPIAGALAGKQPKKLKALLMLAPVNAPDGERIFWFNGVFKTRVAKWLLPKFIEVANVEKLGHAAALEAIAEEWTKIQVPVKHLHCMDDWIAPFDYNTNWSKKQIPAEQLE
ncbi:MAG: alpha/beta hydrolase, partial [Bacteroidota bacterium]